MFDGYQFDLSGGRLPLDFANTLSRMSGDHLNEYGDLVAFCVQSGQIDEPTGRRLLDEARERPAAGAAVLARARALRGALFRLFAGTGHRTEALGVLNGELARAGERARLAPDGDGYRWSWSGGDRSLERPLWSIVRGAAQLLTEREQLERVRVCASDSCDWLFLDLSRNRSRQWCDMKVCGNRAKVRRFHQRHRAAAAG
jgi:predicted RNA-binding Zn ribbon-like protein